MGNRVYRPSELLTYEDCPAKYCYQYKMGIRTRATSANLVYGSSFHAVPEAYLKDGNKDCAGVFKAYWDKMVGELEVDYSTTWDPDELLAAGLDIAQKFPAFWESSGFVPLLDIHGPVVERRFQAQIAPGISLSTRLDIAVITSDAEIVLLDWKTPASVTDCNEWLSDQLTCQQIVFEANGERVGIERIDGIGFANAVKRKVSKTGRGRGPEFAPVEIMPARSEAECREYVQKVIWIDEDIQRGRFPRRGRMAHNTPCGMCDYRRLCFEGDWAGLVKPDDKQVASLI